MNIGFNPLSYFPQGGKDDLAPSPLGEGWEGGIKNKNNSKSHSLSLEENCYTNCEEIHSYREAK